MSFDLCCYFKSKGWDYVSGTNGTAVHKGRFMFVRHSRKSYAGIPVSFSSYGRPSYCSGYSYTEFPTQISWHLELDGKVIDRGRLRSPLSEPFEGDELPEYFEGEFEKFYHSIDRYTEMSDSELLTYKGKVTPVTKAVEVNRVVDYDGPLIDTLKFRMVNDVAEGLLAGAVYFVVKVIDRNVVIVGYDVNTQEFEMNRQATISFATVMSWVEHGDAIPVTVVQAEELQTVYEEVDSGTEASISLPDSFNQFCLSNRQRAVVGSAILHGYNFTALLDNSLDAEQLEAVYKFVSVANDSSILLERKCSARLIQTLANIAEGGFCVEPFLSNDTTPEAAISRFSDMRQYLEYQLDTTGVQLSNTDRIGYLQLMSRQYDVIPYAMQGKSACEAALLIVEQQTCSDGNGIADVARLLLDSGVRSDGNVNIAWYNVPMSVRGVLRRMLAMPGVQVNGMSWETVLDRLLRNAYFLVFDISHKFYVMSERYHLGWDSNSVWVDEIGSDRGWRGVKVNGDWLAVDINFFDTEES